jgi:GT2 family glycosyltransferase
MSLNNLSILIPTRNREVELLCSLQKMRDIGFANLQFWIYDDASDDPKGTARASGEVSHCNVIVGRERRGQAFARNRLAEACKTKYFLFMDDDTWFRDPGDLWNILESNLNFAGLGQAAAVCSQVIRAYDGLCLFPKNMPRRHVPNFVGMGVLFNREVFLSLGGFRDFFLYRHEETEFSLRLWGAGYKIIYEPSMLVEHFHTPSARNNSEYDMLSARNLILMYSLNLPGLHGMPEGMLRAFKLLTSKRVDRSAVVHGILAGIRDAYRFRDQKTIMSTGCYQRLRNFNESMKGQFKGNDVK